LPCRVVEITLFTYPEPFYLFASIHDLFKFKDFHPDAFVAYKMLDFNRRNRNSKAAELFTAIFNRHGRRKK